MAASFCQMPRKNPFEVKSKGCSLMEFLLGVFLRNTRWREEGVLRFLVLSEVFLRLTACKRILLHPHMQKPVSNCTHSTVGAGAQAAERRRGPIRRKTEATCFCCGDQQSGGKRSAPLEGRQLALLWPFKLGVASTVENSQTFAEQQRPAFLGRYLASSRMPDRCKKKPAELW